MPERRRVAVELLVLGVLSSGFLALFPHRPISVDLLLALLAVALVLLNAGIFLLIGVAIGYQGADWPGAKARILHPYLPTAVLLYLPWALLQQTLFQFYLLGRVCMLCPSLHPLAQSLLNGLIFGLVHTTDIRIALVATLGGTLWSVLYLRYRRLWPLAVSHALIGTTFYYWVYGSDLASRWRVLLGSA
jgi:hypothetical protein